MKKHLSMSSRKLVLIGVLMPLLVLFIFVVLRSGPLAAVPVMVTTVESRPITPALFGIGTVEARYSYRIGPTAAGRVARVEVQVGDRVSAGALLGEMEPVDLDQRVSAQQAALKRAEAQLQDVNARHTYAQAQVARFEELAKEKLVSSDAVEAKRQEAQVAAASLQAVREDLARLRAERDGSQRQRGNLRLIAPVDGLVTARNADPGTTVVAGQAVVELIDPNSLWLNVRFDQLRTAGLREGLPAQIVLRSQGEKVIAGRVLRVEPRADAVTEETLVKVVFDKLPEPLPPIGELSEVTVALTPLAARPVVPNASVQRVEGELGVWVINDGALHFRPVSLGASDLDGQVQIMEGVESGAQVVVYSQRALTARSRFTVVERLPGIKL
ncbi:MAG TPA: efflux RND transporter periplasmic adaptor subunit [Gammaproteobacteria bacterium]